MSPSSATASPRRRRQKLVPQGVPFSELSRSQQKAVLNLRKLRKEMAEEIERMIAFLDSTDGYSTIETEGDAADPTDVEIRTAERRYGGLRGGVMEDDEPSLGFTENHPECWDELGGYWWAYRSDQPGGRQDLEQGSDNDCEGDEHDGCEPDEDGEDGGDDEFSLGSLNPSERRSQESWSIGLNGDREDEHDGREPSLGWTVDGAIANTSVAGCDLESDLVPA